MTSPSVSGASHIVGLQLFFIMKTYISSPTSHARPHLTFIPKLRPEIAA